MTWYHGLWFPVATSPDIVRRGYAEVIKGVALPETRKYLADKGLIHTGTSLQAFGKFLRKDIVKQADIVKRIGTHPN